MRDHPRSFRLTGEALEALEWLHASTGISRNAIVGSLLLEEKRRREIGDLTTRVDGVEERLARLEGKMP